MAPTQGAASATPPAASSGSRPKAPGFAGGYLQPSQMKPGVEIFECFDLATRGLKVELLSTSSTSWRLRSKHTKVNSIDELLNGIADSKFKFAHISTHGSTDEGGERFRGGGRPQVSAAGAGFPASGAVSRRRRSSVPLANPVFRRSGNTSSTSLEVVTLLGLNSAKLFATQFSLPTFSITNCSSQSAASLMPLVHIPKAIRTLINSPFFVGAEIWCQ